MVGIPCNEYNSYGGNMSLGAKLQPIIIISAAFLGVVMGRFTILGNVSTGYIELFLMMLLYVLFICFSWKWNSNGNNRYSAKCSHCFTDSVYARTDNKCIIEKESLYKTVDK